MAHHFCLLPLLLFIALTANAQRDFREARLRLQDGRQLRGEVEYPNWAENTNRLLYRSDESQDAEFIPTQEISSLVFTDEPEERFYGKIGQRLLYSTDPDRLLATDSLIYVQDTLLLQAVVEGSISFFYYEQPDGTPHYFIDDGSGLEELIHHRYIKIGRDRKLRKRHDRYLEQLSTAMRDCPKTVERLQGDWNFNLENLLNLVVDYNNCGPGQQLDYSLVPTRHSVTIGGMAGMAYTRVSQKRDQLNNLGSGAIVPRLGFSLLVHRPGSNGRSGYMLEGLYAPFQTDDNLENINVDANYLQFNLGLRKSGNADIFGSAYGGLSVGFQGGNADISGLPNDVFWDTQIGLFGGFGIGGDHFELSLRYEINNAALLLGNAPTYISNTLSLFAIYRL